MMNSACLIGDGSPTLVGIADSPPAPEDSSSASRYSALSYTCLVNPASVFASGTSMNETRPFNWLPWCWKLGVAATGSIGRFTRLGPVPAPLPLATMIRLPSALVVTSVGYQPVGRKPSGLALPRSSIAITDTELLSALAT